VVLNYIRLEMLQIEVPARLSAPQARSPWDGFAGANNRNYGLGDRDGFFGDSSGAVIFSGS